VCCRASPACASSPGRRPLLHHPGPDWQRGRARAPAGPAGLQGLRAQARNEAVHPPPDFLGSIETWNDAEAQLKATLDRLGEPYTVNEGDGAFYGPKIDFDVTDAIGRKWQCATIQLDYQLPERFDLHYVGADNAHHRPIVVHRAIFGSFERFLA
jgi:threonyl-tRNA synthetase